MTTRLRNRVRAARQAHSMTQRRLAELAKVSRQTLSDIEKDDGYEPRAAVMRRLSDALNDAGLFWWESDYSVGDDADVEQG